MNDSVRIDKWLWAIRAFKTRSVAAEACKSNRVLVNGATVKASKEIKRGDVVSVKKMPVVYSFEVIEPIGNRQGAANVPLYAKNITSQEELDKLKQNVTIFVKRDSGTGRPTKKERRDIDELMEEFFEDDE